VKTKYYTFHQNNSGGDFEVDTSTGLAHYVIVEAADSAHANSRAEALGIYFDGCENERDCECCGDRWHRVDEYDAEESPLIYGEAPEQAVSDAPMAGYFKESVAVHPLDGPFKWYAHPESPHQAPV